MPVSVTCPPVERLQDLAVGRVSDADLESLGSHVLECSRCGETISRLHVTDTIADALQAVPRIRLELPRGVLDAAIQQACQLAEQTSVEANDDTQSSITAPDSAGSAAISRQTDFPFDLSEILAPPRSPDELGRLGPYRVLRLLGAGGMGLVFLAEDERLQRPVAIKAIRPALAASRDSRHRFLREARAAAALRHDHIVTIHQVGAHDGTLWLAMELLEGESLHARLHRDQRLTPLEAVRIARQIAEALAAAHSLGLVHRDIKPANVWLENRTSGAGEQLPPRVKVLDFGLARTAADDAQITQSGVIVGTPAYMAPEQARGDHVDARCDLFSLGCVLYRMLAGHAPFRGHGTMAVLMALATHNPPPVRGLAPDVPAELDELTSRLLAKNPADRPLTATAVACALAAIEAQIVSPPPPVLLPEGRGETLSNQLNARKPLTRVHWLIASAIASLLGLALAGVLLQITTPIGTIVLEVDQPELVGAVVTVDDKQIITIKTNESPEPITVVADEKQHMLKVEKGGFETFTRQFTVKAGKTQAIRVRLQPRRGTAVSTGPEEKAAPAVALTAPHPGVVPGLDFSGRIAGLPPWVDLFPIVPNEPLTIELYATTNATAQPNDLIGVWSAQANLFLNARGGVWRWSTYNYETQQIEEISAERLIPGKRTHLAGIWTGEELQFFVDGRFQGRLEPTRKIGATRVPTLFGAKWSDYTPFPGTIDEARLSKIVRYYSDFIPPANFANDRDTLALYHFDEGKGVVLVDSSGNNRHGQIVNAKWVPDVGGGLSVEQPATDEPDRGIANWLHGRGVVISLARRIDNGELFSLPLGTRLPDYGFRVRRVTINDSASIQVEELGRLAELPELTEITGNSRQLDGKAAKQFASLQNLESLHISPSNIPTSALVHLKHLPVLHRLHVNFNQLDDNWASLRDWPALRELTVMGRQPASLDRIAEYSRLRLIILVESSISSDDVERIQQQNPLCRVVTGKGAAGKAIGRDPVREAASRLLARGIELQGILVFGKPRGPLTQELLDGGTAYRVTGATIPKGISLTDDERALLTRFFGSLDDVNAVGLPGADALAAVLGDHSVFWKFDFSQSDLTDTGLAHLHRVLGLDTLNIRGTAVSREAADAFHAAVPRCNLFTDFGVFRAIRLPPREHRSPSEPPTTEIRPTKNPVR